MTDLVHCIYASSAVSTMTTDELKALLAVCRTNNERLGHTGMLLHAEGSFFQVLEGAADVVDATYAKILLDPRHTRVTKIVREPIASRSFPEWSMGLYRMSERELRGVVGANDFFRRAGQSERLYVGRAKELLRSFRDGKWRRAG